MASILGLALMAGAPAIDAAAAITLTTPFPAIAVAPGSAPAFDLTVTTAAAGRVDLAVGTVPTGWTADLRGGGFTIDGIQSDGTTATKLTLNVTVPADATGGTQRIDVTGTTAAGAKATLGVSIRVAPNAAGSVTLTTDAPQLKGDSSTTLTFTTTLTNDTPEDLPFSATATGPDGWTLTATVGSTAQAASVVVKAGSTETVTVTAKPAADAPAADYPIALDVKSGSRTAHADLTATITGSYKLGLSTPTGVLSANASSGSATDLTLSVSNTGTSDVVGAAMAATAPNGWVVKFDPATVDVPAGQTVSVVAHMTPSSDAITGDYTTTMSATASTASATTDIRVTVQTSSFWGVIGVGLIVIVLAGLWLVFRRFGRR